MKTYHANYLYFISYCLLFLGLDVFIIFFLINAYGDLGAVVMGSLLAITFFWTTLVFFRRLINGQKALKIDDKGITYFGKFVIAWEDINYIIISHQVSAPPVNTTQAVVIGAVTNPALGGGLGAYAQMSKHMIVRINPKNTETYLQTLSPVLGGYLKLVYRLSGNKGEVIALNIKPHVKADIQEVFNLLNEKIPNTTFGNPVI